MILAVETDIDIWRLAAGLGLFLFGMEFLVYVAVVILFASMRGRGEFRVGKCGVVGVGGVLRRGRVSAWFELSAGRSCSTQKNITQTGSGFEHNKHFRLPDMRGHVWFYVGPL